MINLIKSPSSFQAEMSARLAEKARQLVADQDFKQSCVSEGMKDKEDMADPDLDAEEQEDAINYTERLPDPGALDHDTGDHSRVVPAGSRPADKIDVRDYDYSDEDAEDNVMPSDIDHKRGRVNEGKKSFDEVPENVIRENLQAYGFSSRNLEMLAKKMGTYDGKKLSVQDGKLVTMNESEDDLYEDIKKDMQDAVKKGEVIELEFDDGDSMDIDPDTASEVLAKAKMSEFAKAGSSKADFMKFLRKVLG